MNMQQPTLVLALFDYGPDSTQCVFDPVRCDKCKHWDTEVEAEDDGKARACLRLKSIEPVLVGESGPPSTVGAYIQDFALGTGGGFPLETFPGFGCSLFEPISENERNGE